MEKNRMTPLPEKMSGQGSTGQGILFSDKKYHIARIHGWDTQTWQEGRETDGR
jgi:hypothetical protein